MHSQTTFLELAGLPAAGKSTAAALIHTELTRQGYRCAVIAEKAAQCPLRDYKRDWRFNAWTLCESVTSMLETELAESLDVVIVDRGLVDALAWLQWFRRTGGISAAEADAVEAFIRIPAWFGQISLTVVLRTEFETALWRRGARGRILNEKTFGQLREAYDTVLAQPDLVKRCFVVDTDQLSPLEVLERILLAVRPLRAAQEMVR